MRDVVADLGGDLLADFLLLRMALPGRNVGADLEDHKGKIRAEKAEHRRCFKPYLYQLT